MTACVLQSRLPDEARAACEPPSDLPAPPQVYPIAVEQPPARPMSATQAARVDRVRAKKQLLGAQFLGRPGEGGTDKAAKPDLPPWWSNEVPSPPTPLSPPSAVISRASAVLCPGKPASARPAHRPLQTVPMPLQRPSWPAGRAGPEARGAAPRPRAAARAASLCAGTAP